MKTNASPIQAKSEENQESQGKSMAPPPFALTAGDEADGGGGGKKNKKHDVNAEPKKGLFEKVKEFNGPLAEKGEGDGHAFDPNDVDQGYIGDCFFMAAMISVARNQPELLENNIIDNEDGSYIVKLAVPSDNGEVEWKEIRVTSNFVVDRKGDPKFARPGDNTELWPMLFEKAYAQLKGKYKKINGGFEIDALETLTGKEYEDYPVSEGDDFHTWMNLFNDAYRQKRPMTLATNFSRKELQDDTGYVMEGLVPGHAYSFVSMNRNDRTIVVQNPIADVGEFEVDFDLFLKAFYVVTVEVENQQ